MESTHHMMERLADQLAAGIDQPIAHRIVEHVWLAVVDGTLDTGARLPTARQIAIALNVSPRTVDRAYGELEKRGVIVRRRGEGTFVSLELPSEADRVRHRELAALCQSAVERTRELGFTLDDLLDTLADFRTQDRNP
jgi:GntR family transcriptional regulator